MVKWLKCCQLRSLKIVTLIYCSNKAKNKMGRELAMAFIFQKLINL